MLNKLGSFMSQGRVCNMNVSGLYSCLVCSREFTVPQALRNHAKVHVKCRNYECPYCGKTFKLEFNFKYHYLNDTGVKMFECGICRKKFSNPRCIETHYRVHSSDKSFKCKKCCKTFSQLGRFRNHIRTHHQTVASRKCGKFFGDQVSQAAHEHVHVTNKPYKCHSCGMRFAHDFNLEVHITSYCTAMKSDLDHKSKKDSFQDCTEGCGKGDRGNEAVEVIILESDSEGKEEVGLTHLLPLEVCLNEGERELNMRDLMQRYDDD